MTEPHQLSEPNWPTADTLAAPEPPPSGPLRLYEQHVHQGSLHDLYGRIRQEYGPVVPVLLESDIPAWWVIGYRELHHVLSHDTVFCRDPRRWNQLHRLPPDWPMLPYVTYVPSMLFSEGQEHRRRAGAISDVLGQVDQFELGAEAERIADKVIDEFAGAGEADLITQFAAKVPVLVVAKLFGLSDDEAEQLMRDMAIVTEGNAEAVSAMERIMGGMQRLLARSKQYPRADAPSRLLAHSSDLTDEEILSDMRVVIVAAQKPLIDWIGNTFRLMLTDSRFALSLAGGRHSVSHALNEVLWEDPPSLNIIGRFASRNTQLAGQRINAGDLLVLGLAAANSDPQVRPDSFTGAQGNYSQMSFSHGEHRCPFPAPELAEVICKTAVEVLLDRLPDVTLAVPPEAVMWVPTVYMRALTALPVRFTPTS